MFFPRPWIKTPERRTPAKKMEEQSNYVSGKPSQNLKRNRTKA
jgi:hypothetical protein